MRFLLLLLLFSHYINLFAQDTNKDVVPFQGYIFSEDSLPVENAYIINYRNLKINVTDGTGYFSTFLQSGDSLMINHLSLAPKIVYANRNKASDNKFYVPIRLHTLKPVFINEVKYKMEMKHAQKNINNLYQELERLGLRNTNKAIAYNPALPFRMMPPGRMSGVSVDVLNLSRMIRESRKARAGKKKKDIKKRIEMDSINYLLRQKEKLENSIP